MKQLFTIAAAALVAASLLAATPDQLFTSGKDALAHDDWDKAAGLFEQAVKANPGNARYHFWLGRAYGEKAGHSSMFSAPGLATKTREQFELAVQLDPNYNDARFGLIEYYMQAPGFLGGSDEKAVQQAQELRKHDPLTGHRAFALIYTRQKKPDLARKEYYDAVREQPNSARAHQSLALFLMSEKNYKQSREELETAIRLDAAFMPAYFRIGQVAALSQSDYVRGEEFLKKYIAYQPAEDEPGVYRAWYWLGQIYEKQGRKADAKQSYTTSLRIQPNQKDVTEALKRVS
jgi:Tfp pilus assembly protein PilF